MQWPAVGWTIKHLTIRYMELKLIRTLLNQKEWSTIWSMLIWDYNIKIVCFTIHHRIEDHQLEFWRVQLIETKMSHTLRGKREYIHPINTNQRFLWFKKMWPLRQNGKLGFLKLSLLIKGTIQFKIAPNNNLTKKIRRLYKKCLSVIKLKALGWRGTLWSRKMTLWVLFQLIVILKILIKDA